MKFEKIELKNFMRYKGTNTIIFRCNDKKNVTVVLGDNTVGKTTIAQAFRFGLYGSILVEKGKKQSDYEFLNEDVLALMDANSRASVSVEIVVSDREKRYTIFREITYSRLVPRLATKQLTSKVTMKISDEKDANVEVDVGEGKIEDIINELFPRNLSHYFLFDGEKWNDISVNGVKENIKDSVHILTGLSSMQSAIYHLKGMGSNSVIRKLKSKITGSGAIFDSLQDDIKKNEIAISNLIEKQKIAETNIAYYTKQAEEIEFFLEENSSTESMQKNYKQMAVVKISKRQEKAANYKVLVNEFSDKAFKTFAYPMIQQSIALLKEAKVERRDVPHMRQKTIDYLIERGICICGTCIRENSREYDILIQQRDYLPPADIGSILGEFEKTANAWGKNTTDYIESIKEAGEQVSRSARQLEEIENNYHKMERELDDNVNFAEKRSQLKHFQQEIRKYSAELGSYQGKIESCKNNIVGIEREIETLQLRNQENAKWTRCVKVAEALCAKLEREFEGKESKVFQELNSRVQSNFERMFNAKDKKIELDKNYNIKMYYKNGIAFKEENNLSEGEKIARNFAFIVTILEYAKNRKGEQNSESDALPIVLDGPFSKLGAENISLISAVLPEIAEQVIIFMLDKDWKYTGLDEYVGAKYFIDKDPSQSYASIREV